jgi:hypothetical protein
MKVIALLLVGSQLSMIGIAVVNLEDYSSSLVEEFRRDLLAPIDRKNHQIPSNNKPPLYEHHHHSKPEPEERILPQQQQPRELIHIVHTRFMQHQGNLTTLGEARLKQFLAFCLPTMVHQSTQDFLWIIKVDPLLEDHAETRTRVLEPLLEAVRQHDHQNIYVVASNYNFNMEGHGGSWRDGQEGEELLNNVTSSSRENKLPINEGLVVSSFGAAKVYTGDMARLQRTYEMREALPVLETRLDADDGLNRRYLERIQDIALDRFLGPDTDQNNTTALQHKLSPKPKWLYWCIMTQIEWHSEMYSNSISGINSNNGNAGNSNSSPDSWELRNNLKSYLGNPNLGYIVPLANENFCITPGLTVGYGVGVTHTDHSVPRYMHTKLFASLDHKYKFCHSEKDKHSPHKGPCLERMGGITKTPDGKTAFTIHAVRSRTLTSAGMDGVGNSDVHNNGKSVAKSAEAVSSASNHSKDTATAAAAASPSNTTERNAKIEGDKVEKMEVVLWRVLTQNFGIDPEQVEQTQKFMNDHRLQIAVENSLGQCSTGHSCKDKARERLQRIVDSQSKQRPMQ